MFGSEEKVTRFFEALDIEIPDWALSADR